MEGILLLQFRLYKASVNRDGKTKLKFLVFGSSQPENPIELGFKTHYLGSLADDISLATVYAAADVFVAPSGTKLGQIPSWKRLLVVLLGGF